MSLKQNFTGEGSLIQEGNEVRAINFRLISPELIVLSLSKRERYITESERGKIHVIVLVSRVVSFLVFILYF